MTKLYPSKKIYVDKSKLTHGGRGVFARNIIKKGEIFEIAPVVLVPELPDEDYPLKKTVLYHYYFRWGQKEDSMVAITLGYGSIYNHSFEPNATYNKRLREKTVEYVALRDIKKGEEIRINYNYGEPRDKTPLWMTDIKPRKEDILTPEFVSVLRKITPEIGRIREPWAIVGSTNLAIRGMKIKPRDIDIVTTKKGQQQIARLLKPYLVEANNPENSFKKKQKPYLEQEFLIDKVEASYNR